MKCKRPNCPRERRPGHRGYCWKHHEHDQRERVARGDWDPGFAPAQAAIDHIAMLMACGMSQRRIAAAAGVNCATVRQIHKGAYKTVRAGTMDKLLSVTEQDAARPAQSTGYVPSIGSGRRLRALVAIGHSIDVLSARAGISDVSLRAIANGAVGPIRMNTAKRIAAVFDVLQMVVLPPSRSATFSRSRAEKNGWHPPFAWDEETIDDPDAEPLNPRRSQRAEWEDTYQELLGMGLTEGRIAERLGVSRESLMQRLRRLEAA